MKGLPRTVKSSLEKARDSALLAVEIYNKPAIKFKSGGYISLMIIAWTSLFHAIFFKRKIKPFYRKENGRFDKREGDFRYWELNESIKQYYGSDTGDPVRKNLEFFIPLRNKIEHRSMPELDSDIFGECQAMLLNFDEMIEKEFGNKYCIRECLSLSLQLFPSTESLVNAIKHNPSTKSIVDFIQTYRSSITSEIISSGKYSFKAFLIQVSNHSNQNALPIQFLNYDKLSEEEKSKVNKCITFIKTKDVPVLNPNLMKAGEVTKKVQVGLGNPKNNRNGKLVDKFNLSIHRLCWMHYKIRPPSNAENPKETKKEYCIYDTLHQDYGYTQAWVDFLIEEMKDEKKYNILFSNT